MDNDDIFGLAILALLWGAVSALAWHKRRRERRWNGIKRDRRKHWGLD